MIKYKLQQGFGLIEVMVVVIIMGFGILSIARLQLINTQTVATTYLDAQATLYSDEIISRLRSNKQAAIEGAYNTPLAAFSDLERPSDQASQATIGRYNWMKNISATLPSAQAAIQCNSMGVCIVAVTYEGTQGSRNQVMAAQL